MVKAQAYSVEAATPRHAHEWRVWEDVKLPEGKILIPGVIAHTTAVVEHPETVAERIMNFARLIGRERVIAGADCPGSTTRLPAIGTVLAPASLPRHASGSCSAPGDGAISHAALVMRHATILREIKHDCLVAQARFLHFSGILNPRYVPELIPINVSSVVLNSGIANRAQTEYTKTTPNTIVQTTI